MRHASSRTALVAALGLAFAIGAGPVASAQDRQFSEEAVESFAVAMLQVQQIGMEAQQQVEAAETPEQQQQLEAEITARMVEAVEAEGLSVEEYQEIATAAQADPELAGQINEYLNESAQ